MPHQAVVPSLALFVIASVITSASQDREPKWSKFTLGGQLSILSMPHGIETTTDPGFGANFEFHFSHRLSLLSEFEFSPQEHLQSAQDGGHTLAFFSGLKANFIQHRKFAIYGEMRPGIVSFSNVLVQTSPFSFENQRVTHFALNLGGGLEYYPSRRTIFRFSLSSPLVEVHSRTTPETEQTFEVISPGKIRSALQASVAVSYRLRGMQEVSEAVAENSIRKWEVGPQFSIQGLERAPLFLDDVRDEVGFGGVGTYRLTRNLALDGSFLFFPHDYRVAGFQDGGRIMQTLGGVRAGRQFGRVGVWLKARPGLQSYSMTDSDFSQFPPTHYPSVFHLALDLGGVVEVPFGRQTAFRFDGGDVMRFHRETPIKGDIFSAPAGRYDTIQFSTAWVWRF
jgi:hypothetical protein